MTDSSGGSNYSVKAEAAQMLGIPLHDGDFVEDEKNSSFVRLVYAVLAENWESWSTVIRLIKARSTTQQVRLSVASNSLVAPLYLVPCFCLVCAGEGVYCEWFALDEGRTNGSEDVHRASNLAFETVPTEDTRAAAD